MQILEFNGRQEFIPDPLPLPSILTMLVPQSCFGYWSVNAPVEGLGASSRGEIKNRGLGVLQNLKTHGGALFGMRPRICNRFF